MSRIKPAPVRNEFAHKVLIGIVHHAGFTQDGINIVFASPALIIVFGDLVAESLFEC